MTRCCILQRFAASYTVPAVVYLLSRRAEFHAFVTLCSLLLSITTLFKGLVLSKELILGIVRAGEGALFATPQLGLNIASESELQFLVSDGYRDRGL